MTDATAREVIVDLIESVRINKHVGRLGCGSIELTITGDAAKKLSDAILAELAAAGWSVVPRVPTVEMEIAGTEEWMTVRACEDRAAVIYRAMLAAAVERAAR
jgi:hypothetical protein